MKFSSKLIEEAVEAFATLPGIGKKTALRLVLHLVGQDDSYTSAFAGALSTAGLPPPDLIVRPSGEQRLSNFLLWEAAYAELVFQDILWPDYDEASLAAAITAFRARDRRFGGAVSDDVLVAG